LILSDDFMLNVLFANKFFHKNGGSEVVMFHEREYLYQQGHRVVDFSMFDERNFKSDYSSYFIGRQNYQAEGMFGKFKSALTLIYSPEAVKKINKLIDLIKPDLVHCHNIYHQLTPSIIGAAKSRGVPVVLTLHDYKPVCPVYTRLQNGKPCSACLEGGFSPLLKYRCADGSLGKSALLYAEANVQKLLGNYEKVDRFIAPSRFMRDSVINRFRPDQVSLLYNGVDSAGVKPTGGDEGYVLYLGRLSHEKGIETLLRAHGAAQGAWPLVVAGTGPLADEFIQKYPTVKFLGHVSGEVLNKTIAGAAALVVPSEWFENCPMSVLEAMAAAKPVIGARMGGIPELVADGETGFLFDAGNVDQLRNCVDRLMADASLRSAMGKAARLRVENEFSLEAHNTGLMEIYKSVLSKS
jgi:glycosyltransferase involved in cell wall biosynthesis